MAEVLPLRPGPIILLAPLQFVLKDCSTVEKLTFQRSEVEHLDLKLSLRGRMRTKESLKVRAQEQIAVEASHLTEKLPPELHPLTKELTVEEDLERWDLAEPAGASKYIPLRKLALGQVGEMGTCWAHSVRA
jgi:hypothetical protein